MTYACRCTPTGPPARPKTIWPSPTISPARAKAEADASASVRTNTLAAFIWNNLIFLTALEVRLLLQRGGGLGLTHRGAAHVGACHVIVIARNGHAPDILRVPLHAGALDVALIEADRQLAGFTCRPPHIGAPGEIRVEDDLDRAQVSSERRAGKKGNGCGKDVSILDGHSCLLRVSKLLPSARRKSAAGLACRNVCSALTFLCPGVCSAMTLLRHEGSTIRFDERATIIGCRYIQIGYGSRISPMRLVIDGRYSVCSGPAQGPKEFADLVRQHLGLLERGEMSAFLLRRPPLNVGVHL